MKIIHHRYLNTNTMSKKKKKKHKHPSPLSPFNNNKFSKKASNLSKRVRLPCVCMFVSQKKKKKGNCPTLLKRVLCVV